MNDEEKIIINSEYDSSNDDENPAIGYTYFEIVNKLLLSSTSNAGGTSTRINKQLKLDDDSAVIFGGRRK